MCLFISCVLLALGCIGLIPVKWWQLNVQTCSTQHAPDADYGEYNSLGCAK